MEATDSGVFNQDIPPMIRPSRTEAKVEHEQDVRSMAPLGDVVDGNINHGGLFYPMSKKPRGLFVIFNHEKYHGKLGLKQRHGTDADSNNLKRVWKKLGFQVSSHDDLSKDAFVKQAKHYAKMDHTQYDCFACAVLSHGVEGDKFYTHDDTYEVKKLIQLFQDSKSLIGKPKLFFIQACRGTSLDEGRNTNFDVTDTGPIQHELQNLIIPTEADVLLAYSTVEGYYSWRNQQDGSWFIKQLTECLEKYHEQLDLMTILTLVNRHVGRIMSNCPDSFDSHGKKQSPSIVSQLTSLIHFGSKKTTVSVEESQTIKTENAVVTEIPGSSNDGAPTHSEVDGRERKKECYELKLRALQKKEELLRIKEQIYRMKLSYQSP